jgi:hypothetical protein
VGTTESLVGTEAQPVSDCNSRPWTVCYRERTANDDAIMMERAASMACTPSITSLPGPWCYSRAVRHPRRPT